MEGDDYRISLRKILGALSSTLKNALQRGTLVIVSLGGAGNLSYQLSLLQSFLCKYIVFLDNDEAGRCAADKALINGYITEANHKYAICNGQRNSELEDCFQTSFYKEIISEQFSVDISHNAFRGNEKWSDRLKNTFLSQGTQYNETTEKKIKLLVAEAIPTNLADVLNEHKRGSIDALVSALEAMIRE